MLNSDAVITTAPKIKNYVRARDWTEEMRDILRAHWLTDMPAAEIGLLVGRSKNAVIGQAHRLKLGPKETPPRPNQRGSTPKEGKMTIRKRFRKAPQAAPRALPLTAKAPISIMELNPNTCRAIVGHGGAPHYLAVYCGDQTFADKSFCEAHCALYFDYDRTSRRVRGPRFS